MEIEENQETEVEEFGISILITNPGYSIISQKILQCLDHNSHLTFRLVSESWKIQVDYPYFWMKRCAEKEIPKNFQVAWTELLQRIADGSSLELELNAVVWSLPFWKILPFFGKFQRKSLSQILEISDISSFMQLLAMKFISKTLKDESVNDFLMMKSLVEANPGSSSRSSIARSSLRDNENEIIVSCHLESTEL